jgi:hypothetical protein
MDVSLAVLADYANVSREGKLNIMGIFDRIFARQLPGQFPPMQLVIRIDARFSELGREHSMEIRLMDPDGEAIFDINGSFTPMAAEPGQGVSLNHIIGLANLPLAKTGDHTVAIWVDNDLKKEVELKVVKAPDEPGQGPQGLAFPPPDPSALH